MNTSGEAADQIVKIFLDGADRLGRLTGTGAKHGAVLLYSLAKQQKKTKGRARLETMLRSGKPLKVYTFKESDLPQFKKGCRSVRYSLFRAERERQNGWRFRRYGTSRGRKQDRENNRAFQSC